MTIQSALDMIAELKPHQIPEETMIGWLSQLDARIFAEILQTHAPDARMPDAFAGYTTQTDRDTQLLIAAPYDEIYRFYLEMQIDLADMEMDKYNNSMALYNNAWGEFARMWHRSHMPKQAGTCWRY